MEKWVTNFVRAGGVPLHPLDPLRLDGVRGAGLGVHVEQKKQAVEALYAWMAQVPFRGNLTDATGIPDRLK